VRRVSRLRMTSGSRRRIAPYVSRPEPAGQFASSIYRGEDAAAILHRHGKSTQAEIHRQLPAISNPPGFSQHELRSDGVGNPHVPRGGHLHEWQVGVDSGGNDAVSKARIETAARHYGWHIRHPYSRGVEGPSLVLRDPSPPALREDPGEDPVAPRDPAAPMSIFDGFPSYDRFRTLHLTGPRQVGADVFALQTALEAIGLDCGGADGILGNRTALAINAAQQKLALAVDGLAGGLTQKALALRIATGVRLRHNLPSGALHGQLEHESGFRLGNYSPQRADGSYDAGVAQRNTAHTPAAEGFHVPDSIEELGRLIREHLRPVRRRGDRAPVGARAGRLERAGVRVLHRERGGRARVAFAVREAGRRGPRDLEDVHRIRQLSCHH
jgi:hypothetical protein